MRCMSVSLTNMAVINESHLLSLVITLDNSSTVCT